MGETVNYEGLLDIVKNHFAEASFLLEEVVESIGLRIKENYPQIEYLLVSVRKNNPPLGAEVESSEVSLEKTF